MHGQTIGRATIGNGFEVPSWLRSGTVQRDYCFALDLITQFHTAVNEQRAFDYRLSYAYTYVYIYIFTYFYVSANIQRLSGGWGKK